MKSAWAIGTHSWQILHVISQTRIPRLWRKHEEALNSGPAVCLNVNSPDVDGCLGHATVYSAQVLWKHDPVVPCLLHLQDLLILIEGCELRESLFVLGFGKELEDTQRP